MGARIEHMGFANQGRNRDYLHAGSKAIKRCLDLAGMEQEQVGMLINTGVYPDKYIQEPAYAALLYGKQKKRPPHNLYGTFSFDLHDGGGGAVMAMRVISGFIESGKIEKGMVVAGDAERLHGKPEGFALSSRAGALLLGAGSAEEGLIHFDHQSYTQYAGLYTSYTNHINGSLKLIVEEHNKYVETCLNCVQESVQKLLKEVDMKEEEIDLIIPSQSPVDFASRLGHIYGGNKVVVVNDKGDLYSVGILAALDKVLQNQQFIHARNSLFISVGPGIAVDLALNRNRIS